MEFDIFGWKSNSKNFGRREGGARREVKARKFYKLSYEELEKELKLSGSILQVESHDKDKYLSITTEEREE